MKKPLTILLALIIAIVFASCNSKPTARQVIGKSYKKCQSIIGGHYEMSRKMKYMSDKDTLISHYTCDFKKMPDDTIYGVYFSSCDEHPWSKYFSKINYLYTGDDFVQYDDTAGTVISCALWSDIINGGKHNRTFYNPIVRKDCYPLVNGFKLLDKDYSYELSETNLDEKPCHFVKILANNLEDDDEEVFGIKTLRYEINIWIDKDNYLPLQYSVAFDMVQQNDTMYQYEECKLLKFTEDFDENNLTLESVPEDVVLSDYEPYQASEPLSEGSLAPDWSLPTINGDLVHLADLKGNVVMLDIFYKGCAPCCAALPFLQSLHEKYKDNGFIMIGIDPIDDTVKDEMADFLEKRGITYTVLFAERDFSDFYRIEGYPTVLLLDRDGNILMNQRGYSSQREEMYEKAIIEALKSKD